MNQALATLSVDLRKVEDAIWARSEAFEKRFCRGNAILALRFDSRNVEAIYLTNTGATWVDSFTLEELSEFLGENPL